MGEASYVDVPDSTARYIARIADAAGNSRHSTARYIARIADAAGNSRRTYAIPTFYLYVLLSYIQ
ncbi:hypothetical protein RR48_02551 [Papilio machaon]|uniref:Uncharacterized protein n=1 Tax=Papilio machaon TaxID=76193 RepID=A0A0N0PEW5_PAPMA|nr:hypothetical protein RR48_02551 [Papilio machaon]